MAPRSHQIADFERLIFQPLLPNKSRGVVRVDDSKVLNGIFWWLRTGSPRADMPERYGPYNTCYNRVVRWQAASVWDRLAAAVSRVYDGDLRIAEIPLIRMHQHAANVRKGPRRQPRRSASMQPDA